MTKRDFYVSVANGTVNEEVMAKANELIEKMDVENEKRKNRVSKKALENEPVKEAICGVLGNEPKTATVIGEEVGISTQKASALLRQLVNDGKAEKTDVKVTGKGVQKGYTLA